MAHPALLTKTSGAASSPLAARLSYLAFATVAVGTLIWALLHGGLDFSVYRAGAMTIFNNEGFDKELYVIDLHRISDTFSLPFTYPPFAALLFVPIAFIPHKLGVALMIVLSTAVSWWVSALIYDYVNNRGYKVPFQDKLGRTGTIAVIAALILLCGPWRRGLALTQINPLIMLLVLADFVRPATRVPRGVLIGIAGGIKLTPLAFGLILLMRKDIKGVLTLGITFATTIAIGFIFLFDEAVEFWTHAVSDPSRVGNINYLDNISIQGWLMHLGLTEGAALSVLHYGLILVLLLGVAAVLPILERHGLVLSQVALNAFLMMAMSPITWSHHNVWYPILAAVIVVDAFPLFLNHAGKGLRTTAKVLAWGGMVGLYISPMWIGIVFWGSDDRLEDIHTYILVISAIPIISLTAFIFIWISVMLTRRRATTPATA